MAHETTDLLEMLEFQRPASSVYEEAFIDKYLRPLPGIEQDDFGNLILDITPDPTILWSSHTDTVHRDSGFQLLQHNRKKNTVTKHNLSKSTCLGADCTTGVWLMLEMIKAKVAGRYVFHRQEECGGRGSQYIRDHRFNEVLKGINCAIAFDRKGQDEVITHQAGRRTASNKFAKSLCEAIGLDMKPSSYGVFTDTENYRDVVPECTNISVGYYGQHTASEVQNLDFALRLRDKMVDFDASKLVVDRDPSEPDYYGFDSYSNWDGDIGRYVHGGSSTSSYKGKGYGRRSYSSTGTGTGTATLLPSTGRQWTSRQLTIRAYADYIDDLLIDLGVTDQTLNDYIAQKSDEDR